MKITFGLLLVFFSSSSAFSQNTEVANTELKSNFITYQPTLPEEGAYEILVNTHNVELKEDLLLQINAHRRFDVDSEWKISEDLVLLIHPFKQ